MRAIILTTLLIWLHLGSHALANMGALLTERLDQLIADDTVRPFNGVILIAKGSETLYETAHGYANFTARTPLRMSDQFRIQSNSKQITAVLILKEVERGTIDLNASISTYLPSLERNWADEVTVHNLLNMTSGITQLDKELAFEPGTDFHYSNPGYGLLGSILEVVTGKPYVDLARDLFASLGMDNSHPFVMGEASDVISGHTGTKDSIRPLAFSAVPFTPESWKRFIPTGGIISTAQDLLTWDRKLHGGELLSDASYDLMTSYSIMAPHAAFGPDAIGYGYGVRIDDISSKAHIGHAGRGIGFASIKFFIPEDDISVIVLENVYLTGEDGGAGTIYHFEREIRDAVLEVLSE